MIDKSVAESAFPVTSPVTPPTAAIFPINDAVDPIANQPLKFPFTVVKILPSKVKLALSSN